MSILPCCDFTLPRDREPVSIVDYSQSKFQDSLRNLHALKEGKENPKMFFLENTCPGIIDHDFLNELVEDGQFLNFLDLTNDLLPSFVTWAPSNVVVAIIDAAEAHEQEWFLANLRMSCLCHRVRSSLKKVPSLIVVLREAQRVVRDCGARIVVEFTSALLEILSSVLKSESEFVPLFSEEVNRFFGKVFELCPDVLSVPSVSILFQSFLAEFDELAPSPKAIIRSPEKCGVSGVLSIAWLVGQLNAGMSKYAEVRRKGEDEMEVIHKKFPIHTRFCLRFLLKFEKYERFKDDLVVLRMLERPELSEGKWICTKEYATTAIVGFLSDFRKTGRNREKIHELDVVLKQIIKTNEFNALDPMTLVALLSQCTRMLPMLLYKMEYVAFLAMAKLLTRTFEACFSVFEDSPNLSDPYFRFIDLLLISPFVSHNATITFASEMIEKCLLRLEPVFVHRETYWIDFIATRGASFASNYMLSRIILRNSASYELFVDLKQQRVQIFKNSARLLETMSHQALVSVDELWINLASYFANNDKQEAISFVYMALKFCHDCLMGSRESSAECYCYFLTLLERLMKCPLFLITFCCFDVFLTSLLSDLDVIKSNSGAGHCLLRLFCKILSRNGSNYDANVMFAYPSYAQLVSIAEMCALCLENMDVAAETRQLASECFQHMVDNKYCYGIVAGFCRRVQCKQQIFVHDDEIGETVADLQLQVNRIVPNRAKKVEIGFDIWRDGTSPSWSRARILQFCENPS